MADDKKKVGKADRAKVSVMERYEIDYLRRKHGVTMKAVKDAVAAVGSSRNKVEAVLKKSKAEMPTKVASKKSVGKKVASKAPAAKTAASAKKAVPQKAAGAKKPAKRAAPAKTPVKKATKKSVKVAASKESPAMDTPTPASSTPSTE